MTIDAHHLAKLRKEHQPGEYPVTRAWDEDDHYKACKTCVGPSGYQMRWPCDVSLLLGCLDAIREAVEYMPERSLLSGKQYETAASQGFVSRSAVLGLFPES